jgi:hypothetical protein
VVAESCFDRIVGDVLSDHEELSVGGHPLRSIAPLEDVSGTLVAVVEVPRVLAGQESHPTTEVGFRRFDQQVEVIVQDAVREAAPAGSANHVGEDREKGLTIRIVDKDAHLVVATRVGVLDRSLDVLARLSGHALEKPATLAGALHKRGSDPFRCKVVTKGSGPL